MDIEKQFKRLLRKWHKDTWHSASIKTDHPAFQAIVEMGEPVVPLIIKHLRTHADWIVVALWKIVPNPIELPEQSRGRLPDMVHLWLDWWDNKHPPTADELYKASYDLVEGAIKILKERKTAGTYHPDGSFTPEQINHYSWIEGAISTLREAYDLNKLANICAGVANNEWDVHVQTVDELTDLRKENRELRLQLAELLSKKKSIGEILNVAIMGKGSGGKSV